MNLLEQIVEAGPFPTSLTLYGAPGSRFPANDTLARLNAKFQFDSSKDMGDESEVDLPGLTWYRTLRVQDYPYPVLVWESTGALPAQYRPMIFEAQERFWPAEDLAAVRNCEARLHVQSILKEDNAQLAYGFLLQVAALLGGEEMRGCYDHASLRLRTRDEVYDLTSSQAPPSVTELYQSVVSEVAEGSDRLALATAGLLRCHRPELGIYHFRPDYHPMAEMLVHSFADMFVTQGVPEPRKAFSLGEGTPDLMLMPHGDLGGSLPKVGAEEFRLALVPAGGVEPGEKKPADFAPDDHQRLADGLLALVQTHGLFRLSAYETHIKEQQARERIDYLQRLFEMQEGGMLEFVYKVGIEIPEAAAEPEAPPAEGAATEGNGQGSPKEEAAEGKAEPARKPREHLWFGLLDIQDGALQGKLLSEPHWVEGLAAGDNVWHKPEDLTDWAVRTPDGGVLTPQNLLAIRYILRRLEEEE